MTKEEITRLKVETDIRNVLWHYGIQVFPRGSNTFLLCPNPSHHDRRPMNCHFRASGDNAVRCEVCNKVYSAIDVIQFMDGSNFHDAVETLWEINGRPTYIDPHRKSGSFKKKKIHLRVGTMKVNEKNINIMQFLGIKLPNTILMPIAIEEKGKDDFLNYSYVGTIDEKGELSTMKCRNEFGGWKLFLSEKELATMMLNRANEIRSFAEKAKNETEDPIFKKIWEEEIIIARSILANCRAVISG